MRYDSASGHDLSARIEAYSMAGASEHGLRERLHVNLAEGRPLPRRTVETIRVFERGEWRPL